METLLTKDNYHKFDDVSIFPHEQLTKFFMSIPKIQALDFMRKFDQESLSSYLEACPDDLSEQWKMSLKYETHTVGELMQPAPLVLNENQTVDGAGTTEHLAAGPVDLSVM